MAISDLVRCGIFDCAGFRSAARRVYASILSKDGFLSKMLLLMLLSIGFGYPSAGVNQILLEARRLTQVGAFDEAITEYKRHLYFHPDLPDDTVFYTIGDLYRRLGKHCQAREAMLDALAATSSDSLSDAIQISLAVISIAEKNYAAAELELLRAVSFSPFTAQRNRAQRLLALVYIYTDRWDKVRESLLNATSGLLPWQTVVIDSLLNSSQLFVRKSPILAQWMSTFLPGSGQCYAGDVRNGVNALAVSLATGYMTVYSIVNGYYQQAILTDVTLFWRYYSGNRTIAFNTAISFNRRFDDLLRRYLIAILSADEPR